MNNALTSHCSRGPPTTTSALRLTTTHARERLRRGLPPPRRGDHRQACSQLSQASGRRLDCAACRVGWSRPRRQAAVRRDLLLLIGLSAMPVAARPISPTAAEQHRLKKAAWGHKTPHQLRQRAHIVLLAAHGRSNAAIAAEMGVHPDTVRRWRGRCADQRLPGLADRKRSGRPRSFTALQRAEAKVLACQLPAETGVPLSRWSCSELAAELTARGITGTISASTVRRWLHRDALKPWQHRSWIFITDPRFRDKAERGPIPARSGQLRSRHPGDECPASARRARRHRRSQPAPAHPPIAESGEAPVPRRSLRINRSVTADS
ncbi:helix-turn-helix domain-containing protein [Streptomyces sp. NPDC048370]|uniref:helix-turn-helix domain-containing protein n=1 Tax=Streptomyces sp. NPDC048370 TaxID=3365540 RepID=UPI00371F4002